MPSSSTSARTSPGPTPRAPPPTPPPSPTDAPQRAERMGGMAEPEAYAPTAARIADVAGFFPKWMTDFNDGQHPDGQFNNVTPAANQRQSYPVWADAGVVIPWEM